MSVNATELAKLTKEEILANAIQRELRTRAVVWPILTDLSNRFDKGMKTAVIPRSTAKTVGNTPNDGSELADPDTTYKTDLLHLDQFKTIHDYVYDVDQVHSVIDLKGDFYAEAMPELAEYIEAAATAQLQADGAEANEWMMPENGLDLETVGVLSQKMSEDRISKSGRILLVSPKQARILRSFKEVRDASAYGNPNSIQNGFIARLDGFDILETVHLEPDEAIAFHREAAAKAVAKEVQIDEERHSSRKRWFCSVDAVYGMKALRAGELIYKSTPYDAG
jgi:hypothetical protein